SRLTSKSIYYHGFCSAAVKLQVGFTSRVVLALYNRDVVNQLSANIVGFLINYDCQEQEVKSKRGLKVVVCDDEVMEDQEEVHDSLLAAKDAKRGEEAKLVALNDVIVEALDEIVTLENNVEILDGTRDDV
ncbi:hypothetical protein Tco_1365149, partial [Tanacetum coccineum]